MTKIIKNFQVRAQPERAFAAIATPEKWPQWASFVRSASSDGPRTHWIYEMQGMKVESDTETSETLENSVYGFRQTRGFLKSGRTRIEIQPNKTGISVTWSSEYDPPYSCLGKLMDRLKAKKQFEEGKDESIKNLTKILER